MRHEDAIIFAVWDKWKAGTTVSRLSWKTDLADQVIATTCHHVRKEAIEAAGMAYLATSIDIEAGSEGSCRAWRKAITR